jgi:DNA-binding NtrC family response regulator
VVDDDAMMRDIVGRILVREGYEVLSADSPHQALKIVQHNSPVDLALTDLKMPEMPGTHLLCEIIQVSPQTAGLLMTASDMNPGDVPEGVFLLRKPFRMRDLLSVVRDALARVAQLSAALRSHCEESADLPQSR